MATTTQILFNSPALHSLKRDQLVKLCKIHTLKASGKNVELIERLKQHAQTLPPDNPLNIATRSENPELTGESTSAESKNDEEDEGSNGKIPMPRPSEQWEVVMDSIAEVDEESTLKSRRGGASAQAGEFGTGGSKGLKRHTSNKSKNATPPIPSTLSTTSVTSGHASTEDAVPESTLPSSGLFILPQINHFTILNRDTGVNDMEAAPIPGQSLRPGLPAPSNARLSTSAAPATTTIRLVASKSDPNLLLSPPKLKPFQTTFDLMPASPAGATASNGTTFSVWPLSPGQSERIYPTIPVFEPVDSSAGVEMEMEQDSDMDIDVPGGFSAPLGKLTTPAKPGQGVQKPADETPKWPQKPSTQPEDIFSPMKATARTSLAPAKPAPFIFGSPLPQHNLSNKQFRSAAQSVLDEMNKKLAEEGVETVKIDVLEQRKSRRNQDAASGGSGNSGEKVNLRVGEIFDKLHEQEFEKMDSIANHYAAKRGSPVKDAPVSKKRKSSVAAVGHGQRPGPAGRNRASGARVISAGARKKMVPGAFGDDDDDDELIDRRTSKRPRMDPAEAGDKQKDEEKKVTIAQIAVEQGERDEEAKRLQKEREAIRRKLDHNKAKRRSSMGRPSLGGKTPIPAQKGKGTTSRFGFLSSAKSLVQNVWNRGVGSSKTTASNIPVQVGKNAPTTQEAKAPPKAGTRKVSVAPGSSGNDTLNPSTSLSNISVTTTSSRAARAPSLAGTSGQTKGHSRNGSTVGVSSLGTRTSTVVGGTRVSSIGTKSIPRSTTSNSIGMRPSAYGSDRQLVGKDTESNADPCLAIFTERKYQITNGPQDRVFSPRSGKIFSQPLSPTSIPSPVRAQPSFGMAAAALAGPSTGGGNASEVKPTIPPKPKVLPGRRPRISRSKVIAKLASQRAAEGGDGGKSKGKIRSSMGANVGGRTRQSYGGGKVGGDVLLSAKKRARQSEYARRRSRAAGSGAIPMDLED
ncbi:hypothetical protein SERLA73DRAFT_159705 [Serpula lacrymans var. lacrymans S7.3]|uniref:SAP domain-containing protein n=1 Tax=Serpula lacrymans var. lacrymans (strain S7.3) TaxID=936435 RepID=F8PS52_SERL3|nr:hypothetical protein SERLA73DRAFT_159705 [Serpula lacrymans var. lacrymans S7.3]